MNVEKGFVDAPIEEGIDLKQAILQLKKEKNFFGLRLSSVIKMMHWVILL